MFSEDSLKDRTSQKPALMEAMREEAGGIAIEVLLAEAKELIKQNQEVLGDGASRLALQPEFRPFMRLPALGI